MTGPRAETPPWASEPADLVILAQLAEGRTIGTIARETGVSERTVRRRLRYIADAIGVNTTIEAVVYAVRSRLI
jgi:DNA-binding NarL/FixJ family response regulator